MRIYWMMLWSVLLPISAAAAAETKLHINNRPTEPNEWGYRPADGSTARMNPPSLTWPHEKPAAKYTVQWAASADFKDAVTVENLPFNTYTHNAALAVGTYFWHYRYTTTKGGVSDWSITRSFSVAKSATDFPMPSRAQQRELVPKEHPRLFMRPEDLPRLRELANGRESAAFNPLRRAADRLLKSKPVAEPTTRASNRDNATRKWWWSNRAEAERACNDADTLAFVYLITGEQKYGQAARDRILQLAAWDPDGPTNFSLNDEAAFPMLYRLPRAYDWAYGALSPEDRAIVLKAMTRRATDAWKSGEVGYGVGHLTHPYESHANRCWHKLAECAIACYGDVPQAEDWLDYAVNKFYAAYPVWSDDDGGWHEGASYCFGYMSKVVWWLQVSKSTLGIDGLKKPFFSQVGDFFLYLAPPNSPNEGFGDLSYNTPSRSWGGAMEYFERAADGPGAHGGYWRWWSQQWRMTPESGILGFLYAANLGALPKAKAPTDLPTSKVFHGVGLASLHTTLLDSRDDVHFLFKSDPMGSQSHGHNPQNSFQLNAYGEPLIVACTYRDWHGSPFHMKWVHSSIAQNTVLVNGQGQVMHKAAPLGKIIFDELTPKYDYVVGDATAAYEGRLTRFQRHVAFVKPDMIVLYDDLAAPEPATFQFMLHALQPFTVDESQAMLHIERPNASLTARYLASAPLKFRQWDGFDPKPEKEFPDQWHLEASTQEPRRQVGMLTVLIPTRAGQELPWTATRLESDTAIGVQITRGGKSTTVAFRKYGVDGKAAVGDLTFDQPLFVTP